MVDVVTVYVNIHLGDQRRSGMNEAEVFALRVPDTIALKRYA